MESNAREETFCQIGDCRLIWICSNRQWTAVLWRSRWISGLPWISYQQSRICHWNTSMGSLQTCSIFSSGICKCSNCIILLAAETCFVQGFHSFRVVLLSTWQLKAASLGGIWSCAKLPMFPLSQTQISRTRLHMRIVAQGSDFASCWPCWLSGTSSAEEFPKWQRINEGQLLGLTVTAAVWPGSLDEPARACERFRSERVVSNSWRLLKAHSSSKHWAMYLSKAAIESSCASCIYIRSVEHLI